MMRKRLICAAFSVAFPVAAMAADVTAPRLSGTISLDGRLDEPMWRFAARLPHTEFKRWVNDSYVLDPSIFHVLLFHDGHTLYVALASHDRHVEADALPEDSDGLYSLSFVTRDGRLKHYRLRWVANPPVAGGDLLDSGRWGAHLHGPFEEPMRGEGGYVLELAIPLSSLGWKPGDTVPINIIVHDHDGNPHTSYHTPGMEFARFAWGGFDNDDRSSYRTLELAP